MHKYTYEVVPRLVLVQGNGEEAAWPEELRRLGFRPGQWQRVHAAVAHECDARRERVAEQRLQAGAYALVARVTHPAQQPYACDDTGTPRHAVARRIGRALCTTGQ